MMTGGLSVRLYLASLFPVDHSGIATSSFYDDSTVFKLVRLDNN